MLLHVALDGLHEPVLEDVAAGYPIDNPLDFGHVHVAVVLSQLTVVGHGKEAEQVEAKAVGHNHGTSHHAALLVRVVVAVEGIVGTEILVQADAQRVVSHDDALVERAYLGIDQRQLQRRNFVFQAFKGIGKVIVDVVHVGILVLHVAKQALQSTVLKEIEELGIDARVIHLADTQHILYQRTRLHREVSVHLLQG